MKITKRQLRQIIRESFDDGYPSMGAVPPTGRSLTGRSFYKYKYELLQGALDYLDRAIELESMSAAGEDPDLDALRDELDGYMSAVAAMTR